MRRRRGRTVVVGVGLVGFLVLCGAGIALREKLLERWCLFRLGAADEAVRRAAAEQLGAMRSGAAVPRLAEILRTEVGPEWKLNDDLDTAPPGALHWSAQALAAIGQPAVAGLLQVLRAETRDVVEDQAGFAIVAMGPSAVPAMVAVFRGCAHCLRQYVLF